MRIGWIGLAVALLALSACSPLKLRDVPDEVAQELLDKQQAQAVQHHQSLAAQEAQAQQNQELQDLINASHAGNFDAARKLMIALTEDPSLLEDPRRLAEAGQENGFEAEIFLMEWDQRAINGGEAESGVSNREHAALLQREGWVVHRTWFDHKKNLFLLYFVKAKQVHAETPQ